jgi:hypothetical protein
VFWGNKAKLEPPRRVIFHFGPPKTATSTFHGMLKNNRSAFGPGIAVSARDDLTSALRSIGAEMLAGKGSPLRKRLQTAVRTLRSTMAATDADTIIVSDENLFGIFSRTVFSAKFEDGPAQILAEVESQLAGWDLQYICYMRDPQKWRDSCYNQTVKLLGATEDHATWIAKHPDLSVPQKMVDGFKSVLGDRLTVVQMEDEAARYGYVGRRVLELSGLDETVINALPVPRYSNVSISPASLEFIRRLNGLGLNRPERLQVAKLVEKSQTLFKAEEVGHDEGKAIW